MNKSVRKHPSLLIYESYRAVNTAVLFILFVFRRSVVTESNYCHGTDPKDFLCFIMDAEEFDRV